MADDVTVLTRFDAASAGLYPGVSARVQAPARSNVLAALHETTARIGAAQRAGVATRLFLVFVGHGVLDSEQMGAFALEDGLLPRTELLALISPLDGLAAHRTHLVIDACNAWFLVHERGAKLSAWNDDRSGQTWADETEQLIHGTLPPGLGLILATSGAQESHETAALNGGVFSHEVRSALLGGADADGDHRITYDELHAFLLSASASIQHARAPSVFVHAPAAEGGEALTELDAFHNTATLALPSHAQGHFRLTDDRGLPYAELNLAGDAPELALAVVDRAGTEYELERDRAGLDAESAVFTARAGETVDATRLAFQQLQKQAVRGSIEDAYRQGLFATPYGQGVVNMVRSLSVPGRPVGVAAPANGTPWDMAVDAGFVTAGSGLPGGAPSALGLGAAFGFGVQVVDRLSLGARVQYDEAELDTGGIKHFIGGVAPRWRVGTAGPMQLDAEALAGVDMVNVTRKATADRVAGTQHLPGNLTGQLGFGLGWSVTSHVAVRVSAAYAVTSPMRVQIRAKDDAGTIQRPVGAISVELRP